MTDQNKTHGVLTDDVLLKVARDTGLRQLMHGINATDAQAELRRFVDALAVEAAPQSPVAPVDERAADIVLPFQDMKWMHSSTYNAAAVVAYAEKYARSAVLADRARLADAPTVSATPFERRESLFNSYIEQIHGTPPPTSAADAVINWPTMPPSRGQSHVLFEDGYAEGWFKCLEACQRALKASKESGDE